MIDRGIYNYVKRCVDKGQTKEQIGSDLTKKFGWNQAQIDEAYDAAKSGNVPDILPPETEHFDHPPARGTTISFVRAMLLLAVLCGVGYVIYYIVPVLDFDIAYSEITAYPALCQVSAGVETYSPNTATPVTFQVEKDLEQVTEFIYANYKNPIDRGAVLSTHVLQNCDITDRLTWKCMDGTATLGFSQGTFFDDAETDTSVCFVSRAQWYRLLYPPIFSGSTT